MPSSLLPFCIASMAIILVPGPSVTFTIARAIAYGRAVAVLTVLGNTIGTYLLSLLIAFGLGPLLMHSRTLSVVLQLLGGIYLIYLGVQAFRSRTVDAQGMVSPHGDRPSRLDIVRQGFVVGILNPKSLVFFAAVFPHFVNRHAGSITEQLVAFGSIFAVMAFLSDSSWGILAGTAREWLMSSHQRLVRMRILSAVVMCSLGLLIIASA